MDGRDPVQDARRTRTAAPRSLDLQAVASMKAVWHQEGSIAVSVWTTAGLQHRMTLQRNEHVVLAEALRDPGRLYLDPVREQLVIGGDRSPSLLHPMGSTRR